MKTGTMAEFPNERRAPAAQVGTEQPKRAQQETRIRQTDHKAVVPAKRLEEMPFLDLKQPPLDPPSLSGRRRAMSRGPLAGEPNTFRTDDSYLQETRHRQRWKWPGRWLRDNLGLCAEPPITLTCDCGTRRGPCLR